MGSNVKQSAKVPPIKLSILEKDESEVSYVWKGCQLFSYIIVVISGFSTSLAIGNIVRIFNNECILYSNLTVTYKAASNTVKIATDLSNSWGDMSTCNFCQYCPVASVIFAGVWATMFMMCGRGGNSNSNLPQSWRIVPPAIIFNFIFVVLASVSVGYIFGGFNSFCSSIVQNLSATGAKITSCQELADFTWSNYEVQKIHGKIILAEAGAVITLLGWVVGFITLLTRCITHVDFVVTTKPSDFSQNTLSSTNCSTAMESPQSKAEQQPLITVEVVES